MDKLSDEVLFSVFFFLWLGGGGGGVGMKFAGEETRERVPSLNICPP